MRLHDGLDGVATDQHNLQVAVAAVLLLHLRVGRSGLVGVSELNAAQ